MSSCGRQLNRRKLRRKQKGVDYDLGMDAVELRRATHSLHRYFIWADRMRGHFFLSAKPLANVNRRLNPYGKEAIEINMYMGLWYAHLYVVVEGWQKLELADSTVDALLRSKNVKLLKRYRHGVCHFQKNYYDERFFELIRDGEDAAKWVRELHDALGAYFLRIFLPKANGANA